MPINEEMRPVMSESRFYMWRAVFAMAHADNKVVYKEKQMLGEIIQKRPFTNEQREVLREDMREPKDVEEMFSNITDDQDRLEFFSLARAVAWSDGDYDDQERFILEKLQKQANLSGVKEGLKMTRKDQRTEKLNDLFRNTGFGGLIDKVEKGDDNE